MDKALAIASCADMAATKAEAKARGRLLGVGLPTYVEKVAGLGSHLDAVLYVAARTGR